MEMSQRIRFWYQILLKMLIFWENGKKSQLKKYFELRMLTLPENDVKTLL